MTYILPVKEVTYRLSGKTTPKRVKNQVTNS